MTAKHASEYDVEEDDIDAQGILVNRAEAKSKGSSGPSESGRLERAFKLEFACISYPQELLECARLERAFELELPDGLYCFARLFGDS